MTFHTKYDPPPIPIRTNDWSAWVDGQEEWGSGFGLTESDAINNLEELLLLRCSCDTNSCIYCTAAFDLYRWALVAGKRTELAADGKV
jgi:hypothetical protein